jgi:hypothetical protein
MVIEPVDGSRNPEIIFKRVVFPHPEGPSNVRNSPWLTSSESSDNA